MVKQPSFWICQRNDKIFRSWGFPVFMRAWGCKEDAIANFFFPFYFAEKSQIDLTLRDFKFNDDKLVVWIVFNCTCFYGAGCSPTTKLVLLGVYLENLKVACEQKLSIIFRLPSLLSGLTKCCSQMDFYLPLLPFFSKKKTLLMFFFVKLSNH